MSIVATVSVMEYDRWQIGKDFKICLDLSGLGADINNGLKAGPNKILRYAVRIQMVSPTMLQWQTQSFFIIKCVETFWHFICFTAVLKETIDIRTRCQSLKGLQRTACIHYSLEVW